MENTIEKVEVLKAKMDTLLDNLKLLRKQVKAEHNKVYSKKYAMNKYKTDEEYRKRQIENAKARYYRLKQQNQQE